MLLVYGTERFPGHLQPDKISGLFILVSSTQHQWTGQETATKMKVIMCYETIMSFNLPALSEGDPFMP